MASVNRLANPLYDVLPQKARKVVYAVLFLALLVYTAVQTAEGDWNKAIGGLLITLTGLLASSNTAVKTP